MDDLYFFPSLNVLIKIVYSKDANSLRYATHRRVSEKERKVIEQYILREYGPQTQYYKRWPSILLYMGIEKNLEKELKYYRLQDTFKEILTSKAQVEKKVKKLISQSLSNYYFERVGDELVKLRQYIMMDNAEKVDESMNVITVLLEAYNQNSGQSIEITRILPKEVLEHFEN
ncbi:MAG: hypothetical protein GXO75_02095 [Calditrichaeota bacterium]|nr:hypothetical protein [Calditrichota bacterium]